MVGVDLVDSWRVWRFGGCVVIASFFSERLARLWIELRGESCVLTHGQAFHGVYRAGEGWVL